MATIQRWWLQYYPFFIDAKYNLCYHQKWRKGVGKASPQA